MVGDLPITCQGPCHWIWGQTWPAKVIRIPVRACRHVIESDLMRQKFRAWCPNTRVEVTDLIARITVDSCASYRWRCPCVTVKFPVQVVLLDPASRLRNRLPKQFLRPRQLHDLLLWKERRQIRIYCGKVHRLINITSCCELIDQNSVHTSWAQ